jgi:hypothetical protein
MEETEARLPSLARDAAVVVAVGLLARLAFLWLLPPHARSADFFSWLRVADVLEQGGNPYERTTVLNWPPLWMSVLFLLSQLSRAVHVPLAWCIQVLLMVVEAGLVVLLFHLLRQMGQGARARRLLLWGIALNPICILQICQHCNFDVLVGFWVAAFVACLVTFARHRRGTDWLLACLFVGVGGLTKTVPLVLVPLCLVGAAPLDRTTKTLGACLVLGPAVLGVGVLFVLTPAAVWDNVFCYRSYPGWFGLTGLLRQLFGDGPLGAYSIVFGTGFAVGSLALSRRLWRVERLADGQLLLAASLLLMVLYVLGPGYSPQYIYWSMPLLLVSLPMGTRRWRQLLLAVYGVAVVTYVLEYALVPTHGMFLTMLMPGPWTVAASKALRLQWSQTVLRLPLFAGYLLLVVEISRSLAGVVRGTPAARA